MNLHRRYITRIAGCLVLWILLLPGSGIGDDSSSKKMTPHVNSRQLTDGGGKIVMSKLWTESPHERLQPPVNLPADLPLSAKLQLQQTISKRTKKSASAKSQRQQSDANHAEKPNANPLSSEISVSINAPPPPHEEQIAETPEKQEPIISEPLMPADLTPLLSEAHLQLLDNDTTTDPQFVYDDTAPAAAEKYGEIQTVSNKSAPEYATQQDSMHDIVGIIARLLLKFSLIAVCCITLFFSFSTLQITKSHQKSP
jgi:hypothetical protein